MFVFNLARYLMNSGHSVTVVTTGSLGEWWPRLAEEGIDHRAVLVRDSFNRLTHVNRVRSALLDFDVIILSDSRYGQAALAQLPSRIVALSVIHSDLKAAYDITCGNAGLADAIVAISPKTHAELVKRVDADRVVMIRHGVNLPGSAESPPRRQEKFAEPRLVYLGRIVQKEKNVFLLPEILRLIHSVGMKAVLDIVGDGPDRAALEQQFREAGVAEGVTFLGCLNPSEVMDVLLRSHLLVAPSFYEGFPLAPLEAQGCGCVPLLSRLEGITDHSVKEGVTGLLADSGSAESFATAACRLLRDPGRWRSMSDAGQAWIRSEFTVKKMGRAYLDLIQQCLTKRRGDFGAFRRGSAWCPNLIGWAAPVPNSFCRYLQILAD